MSHDVDEHLVELLDTEHCPTCHEVLTPRGLPPAAERCGAPDPTTLADVAPVRCRLWRGHRSAEHWHPALWPGMPALLWVEP